MFRRWACCPGCMTGQARRKHAQLPEGQVREDPGDHGRERGGSSGRGWNFSARLPRRSRSAYVGQATPGSRRAPTAISAVTIALAYGPDRGCAAREAAVVPRFVPDHPGLGHHCMSWPSTSSSACARSRPRTRSRAAGSALQARRSRDRWRSPPHPGPACCLKAETVEARGERRAADDASATSSGRGRRPGCRPRPEQADLLAVMFGRNGESPLPIVAARSPADCFPIPRSRRPGSRSSTGPR